MFITLKNNFGVDRAVDTATVSDSKLTENWLNFIIQKGYASGLGADKRRIYTTIAEKIEVAVKADQDYLELNPVEYQFLKTAFDNAIVDPKFAAPVTVVENAVFNATVEMPTPSAAPAGE